MILIITILIGLLSSGLRGAREAARTAVCLSNQAQIAVANSMYAAAWKDHVPREGSAPPTGDVRAQVSWAVALRHFLDDRVELDQDLNDHFEVAPYYLDPARPRDGHRISYVVNAFPFVERGVVDITARNNFRFRRGPTPLVRLRFPETTLYLSEFADDPDGYYLSLIDSLGPTCTDCEYAQLYDAWDPLHIQVGSQELRIAPNRHGRYGNAMYLDGHAATLPAGVLTNLDTWDDRDYGSRSGN